MEDQVDRSRDLLDEFLHQIVTWAPKLLGAILIFLIGYIVAKAIAKTIRKLLRKAKLDSHLKSVTGSNMIQRAIPSPTSLLSSIVFWVIFLGVLSLGVGALGIPLLTDLIRGFYSYLPNILVAILIFLIASAISAAVSTLVTNIMGDTPTGKILASGAPILVMVLAVFMILNQLKIAPEIVTITYAALVGSVALGSALAFGLGGRDVAAKLLDSAYKAGRQHKSRVASDVQIGAEEAGHKANNLRRQL